MTCSTAFGKVYCYDSVAAYCQSWLNSSRRASSGKWDTRCIVSPMHIVSRDLGSIDVLCKGLCVPCCILDWSRLLPQTVASPSWCALQVCTLFCSCSIGHSLNRRSTQVFAFPPLNAPGCQPSCLCRAALNKLRAAIGDEAIPGVLVGTAAGPDAADVVPADSDSSPVQSLPASGRSPFDLTCNGRTVTLCTQFLWCIDRQVAVVSGMKTCR